MWIDKIKGPSSPKILGTKGQALRGTTRIPARGAGTRFPVTAEPPSPSQGPLPGEPSGTGRDGSQPVAVPLLGSAKPAIFPFLAFNSCTYNILLPVWQGGEGEKLLFSSLGEKTIDNLT